MIQSLNMNIISIIVFCLMVVVNFSANHVGVISDINKITITPQPFTFAIWGLIYAWLFVMHILLLIDNSFIYKLNTDVLLFLTINYLLNILWIFTWTNSMIITSSIVIIGMLATIFFAYYNMHEPDNKNISYYFTSNGISLYAGWLTCATLLNIGIILFSKNYLELPDFSIYYLIISLLLFVLVWLYGSIKKNNALDGIFYFVPIVWGLIGIFAK